MSRAAAPYLHGVYRDTFTSNRAEELLTHRRWRTADRPRCGTCRNSSARVRRSLSASSSCPYRTACYSWDTFLLLLHLPAASWWPLDLQHVRGNVALLVTAVHRIIPHLQDSNRQVYSQRLWAVWTRVSYTAHHSEQRLLQKGYF